jgi:hypothetical protein
MMAHSARPNRQATRTCKASNTGEPRYWCHLQASGMLGPPLHRSSPEFGTGLDYRRFLGTAEKSRSPHGYGRAAGVDSCPPRPRRAITDGEFGGRAKRSYSEGLVWPSRGATEVGGGARRLSCCSAVPRPSGDAAGARAPRARAAGARAAGARRSRRQLLWRPRARARAAAEARC